jgi:drug/metabolite transporter (DMT)-like permease
MSTEPVRRPIAGAICGLASAMLFGASAPVAKRLLPGFSSIALAGFLYGGAAIGLSAVRMATRRGGRSAAQERWSSRDRWLMAGSVAFGGVLGPVLMLTGLRHVSGVSGALLLNLEALFTILLAVIVFGDRLRRQEIAGVCLILGGAVVLSYGPGDMGAALLGVGSLVGATLSWGLDNNLMQRLSARDPIRIVQIKAAAASCFSLALASTQGISAPSPVVAVALALGFVSYGISVVLDVYALRYVGAAREGAYFATAPFAGALLAVPVLGESIGAKEVVAGLLMAIGVWGLATARHKALD